MSAYDHPFSCQYTPNLPELLTELNTSVALSTYQAGKVILLGSDGDQCTLLPRNFDVPMGMSVKDDLLAIAGKQDVTILANDRHLAASYPKKPETYDALFLPRQTYYTGPVAMHDIAWQGDDIIGVNTTFSCLCKLDRHHSFKPLWRPSFINKLEGTDQCHLNGMATDPDSQKPVAVSALGNTSSAGGWRENKLKGGIIMDIASNDIIAHGLAMPHSPRIYNGALYCLLSATGQLVRIDPATGKYDEVNNLGGFVRGMSRKGDYLFIGLSKLRKTHTFGDLPLARKPLAAGMAVLHLPSGAVVAQLQFHQTCEEIYDVVALPGMQRPGILGPSSEHHAFGISLPEDRFWAMHIEAGGQ